MRLVVDTFEFGSKQVPGWNTISISGYHIARRERPRRRSSPSPGERQEYVRWGVDRGLKVDDFAPRLSSSSTRTTTCSRSSRSTAPLAASGRARCETLRRENAVVAVWRFHTQTAGVSLTPTAGDQTSSARRSRRSAAVLGGHPSRSTRRVRRGDSGSNEKAARIALRTQQILAHESGRRETRLTVGSFPCFAPLPRGA